MDLRVEQLESELQRVLESLRTFETTVNGNTNLMTQMQDRITQRVDTHEGVIKRQIDEAGAEAARNQEALQGLVNACRLEFGSNQTRLLNIEGQLAPLLGAVGGGGKGGAG